MDLIEAQLGMFDDLISIRNNTISYFNEKCGTPRFLCTFLLDYKKILAYRELRMLSHRYLRRYFPEDLKVI